MARRVMGRTYGPNIAEALGLDPKRVKNVSLTFDADKAASALVEVLVTDEELEAMGLTPVAADAPLERR